MAVAIITGSGGLVGSEAARHFAARGMDVVGVDNDMRRHFFGAEASTQWQRRQLETELGRRYRHADIDIRSASAIDALFARYAGATALVVHAAAQPSHDWAAQEPATDFAINAGGTLNLLEATRRHAGDSVFIFCSTNKVYGDRPNHLPLVETETRWTVDPAHGCAQGIDETMSIDQCTHSVFGASKVAADVMVQEYGRYFGLKTGVFRGGCLTGPNHSGAALHGFLAYLMKCAVIGQPYTVLGYKGKQVRDNIHSRDLLAAFQAFVDAPRAGEVYNMGGGVYANCSMIEAIRLCEAIAGRPMQWSYESKNRVGDHIWYVSDLRKFQTHYPGWQPRMDIEATLREIHAAMRERHAKEQAA
ncbi:MAG: NAD-dependent epimerase/dehydratase family protein [Alphaproteobacteria bacterium]|nr:NAD-dependent epimerase/dehydratase family protein [Alphaproteobacteria bacterium]